MRSLRPVFECLPAAWDPGSPCAGLEPRRFPAFGGGDLLMAVPAGWQEEIVLDAAGTTITLRNQARRRQRLHLRAMSLTPAECREFSIEALRQEVDRAAQAAGGRHLQVFAGRYGGGFFYSHGVSPLGMQVRGRFLTRPLVIEFTIEGRLRQVALEVIRSARAVLHQAGADGPPITDRPASGATDW